MMKHLWLLFGIGLLLLGIGAAQAQLTFNFDPAAETEMQGNSAAFYATMENTGTDTIYFNGFSTQGLGAGLNMDTSPFKDNGPLLLDGGEEWAGNIFNVEIDPAVTPGNYIGSFTLFGGADDTAQDELSTQNFLLTVQARPADVPEPNLYTLFTGCSVFGMGIVLSRLRRR